MRRFELPLMIALCCSLELSFGLAFSLVGSIFLGIYTSRRKALLWSMVLGLLVDIFFGWPLGFHGAFYLLLCSTILLYTRRFHSVSFWFFILATLVFSLLNNWIFLKRPIEHVSLLLVAAVYFYWRFHQYRFKRADGSY